MIENIVFAVLFGLWSVACFVLGEKKAQKKKVYKNVRLLNTDLFDKSTLDCYVERYENEGYYFCKDACYGNILVFVNKDEL